MSISLQAKNHWKSNQKFTFESLRPTAKRQIESLVRRMEASGKRSFYLEEIKKVILHEQNRTKNKNRGGRRH